MAAREVYNKAVLNYNNMITEAKLQNSSALAEIGFNTLMQSLETSLAGFQYKNTLLLEKTNAKRQIEDRYYTRYQDRISQINTENSMAEQQRQYNQDYQLNLKKLQEDQRQFDKTFKENQRQFNENLAWQKKKSNLSGSGGSGGGSGGKLPKKKQSVNKNSSSYKKQTLNEKQQQQKAKKNALSKAKKVKTKQDAQKLLKSLGITSGISIIDSVTWNKAKRMGDGGSDVANHKNYATYLQEYCRGLINGNF